MLSMIDTIQVTLIESMTSKSGKGINKILGYIIFVSHFDISRLDLFVQNLTLNIRLLAIIIARRRHVHEEVVFVGQDFDKLLDESIKCLGEMSGVLPVIRFEVIIAHHQNYCVGLGNTYGFPILVFVVR